MSGFKKKKINKGQTLSDKLKKARLENEFSLLDLHIKTNIQLKYLQALEDGDYKSLPGDIYARTWIKICADTLGLSSKELLENYLVEKETINKTIVLKNNERKTNKIKHSILKPNALNFFIIALVIVALLGFLSFKIVDIIKQPQVIITEPANNFKTIDNNILIKGDTETGTELSINNEIILLDDEGGFEKRINLSTGLNNLIISAKKKHSRTYSTELIIFRESLEEENN